MVDFRGLITFVVTDLSNRASRFMIMSILLFNAMVLGASPAWTQPVTGNFTCDNGYAVWVGDASSVNTLLLQGTNTLANQIRHGESVSFNVQPDFQECYFYLIAWSDDATYQGIIGSFTGSLQVDTGDPRWQVLHTNDDIDTYDAPPTAGQINAKISTAATNTAIATGAGGACVQGVWDNNSGSSSGEPCWTDPYLGSANASPTYPFTAFGTISGISNTAKWMWYDSTRGLDSSSNPIGSTFMPYWPTTQGGKSHPFADQDFIVRPGGHGEYLVFRIPCDVFFAPNIEMSIDKQALNSPWQAGGTGSYEIVVTNTGNSIAPGSILVVEDDGNFPSPPLNISGMTGEPGWDCISTPGQCSYTVPANTPVQSGTSWTFTVNVSIDSDYTGGGVNNCAELTSQQEGEALAQEGSSCAVVQIKPAQPPVISKTAIGPMPWQAGGTGTFSISVEVPSGISANQSIAVQDMLPSGFTLIPTSITPSGVWNCNQSTGTCYLNGPIAAGTTLNVTFDVQLPKDQCGNVKNCADVDITDRYDPRLPPVFMSEGQSCVDVEVAGCTNGMCIPAKLNIKKTHKPANFVNSGTGTIGITVSNNGSNPVFAPIQVIDQLPAGLSMPPGSFSPSADLACMAGLVSPSPQQISCAYMGAALSAGGSFSFNFQVSVSPIAGKIVKNHASVTKGCCGTEVNDETTDDIPIEGEKFGLPVTNNGDISITKKHSPSRFSTGSRGSFKIVVKNKGHNLEKGMLTLVDHMPAGLSVKIGDFRANSWRCKGGMISSNGQDVTCTYNRRLGKKSRATLNLNVDVAPAGKFPADVKEVENCATASVKGTVKSDGISGDVKACDKVKIRHSTNRSLFSLPISIGIGLGGSGGGSGSKMGGVAR